jgi:dihydroorotate dehydrogenase electron transfer subunit
MADFYIGDYKIKSNECLTKGVYEMVIEGDTSKIKTSGQFINIKIEGFYLRRPISICDYDDKTITLIYKVIGEGTEVLSTFKKGDLINCMTGLGNGYDYNKKAVIRCCLSEEA